MRSRGVLFVATQAAHYVEEAFLSAESIKRRHPELSITLFTDKPENGLCDTGCFDDVKSIKSVSGFSSNWAAGQLNRLNCLPLTPYEHTLHLDTDTRVLTNELPSLFERLESVDVAMVEDPVEQSYARRQSGRAMFNAGFILYRRNPLVWSWLEKWASTTRNNFLAAERSTLPEVPELAHVDDEDIRRQLLRMDQISLMELLSPDVNYFGLACETLDYTWNYRGPLKGSLPSNEIRISHSQIFRATTIPDILDVAYQSAAPSGAAFSNKLYDYVTQVQPAFKVKVGWMRRPRVIVPEEWASDALRQGDLHFRYGQLDKASNVFGAIVRSESMPNMLAVAGMARIALRAGHNEDALRLAESAAMLAPESAYVQLIHGEALAAVGRLDDALTPLMRAQALGGAEASFQLGLTFFKLERYAAAVKYFQTALRIDANHVGARSNILPGLLGMQKYSQALAYADQLLVNGAYDVRALAFRFVALAELGRTEAMSIGLEELVKIDTLFAPNSYATITAFNRELSGEIVESSQKVYEPRGNTTHQGYHVQMLAESKGPALRALNEAILAAVKARRDESQKGAGIFHMAAPRSYQLQSWAVVLDEEGYQSPHIHPLAWMSGVYYVEVPPDVSPDDPEKRGWILFGRSEDRWYRKGTMVKETAICPTPGMLITFPSYFWHRTIPVKSGQRRISYAFDIVPA